MAFVCEDGHVCPTCAGAPREPHRFSDMRPGENYPPLHPRCRCVVTPHVTDWDAWLDQQADREAARTKARRMGAEGRKAVDTDGFGGSFGPSLDEARQAYANARDVGKTLRERTGVNAEVSRGVRALAPAKRGSLFAAIERAIEFVGGKARNLRFVGDQSLGDGVIAEMRRRGDDGTMYLDLASIEAKTNDEVEQIAFHEMAHAAEWRFTTPGQWELEEGRRGAWLDDEVGYLLQGTTSKELLEALRDAGVSARYDPVKGKIVFGKRDALKARDISYYALDGADPGTQDSELIAEALRFACVNGQGMNAVADAIARRFADGS